MDISKELGGWDNYSCLENAEARCNGETFPTSSY